MKQLLIKLIIVPLIEKGLKALWKFSVKSYARFKAWLAKRKLKKINQQKVEDYENAENEADSIDSYNNLP